MNENDEKQIKEIVTGLLGVSVSIIRVLSHKKVLPLGDMVSELDQLIQKLPDQSESVKILRALRDMLSLDPDNPPKASGLFPELH